MINHKPTSIIFLDDDIIHQYLSLIIFLRCSSIMILFFMPSRNMVLFATGLMHEASIPAHQIHVKTVGRSHTKLQKPARQKPAGRSLAAPLAFVVVLCPPGSMMMMILIHCLNCLF